MFYKIIAFLFLLLFSLNSYGRKWHKENIDSVLSISFPTKPIHHPKDEDGWEQYLSHQAGCVFSLTIKSNIIEDYYGYLLAADSTRESWANFTLDWVVDSKVNQPFHYLISKQTNRFGYNYFGMDIVYATRRPSMQESNKRFSKLLLLGNTLYVLEVWYMDGEIRDLEKDKFFNSVLLKKTR